MTTNCQLLYGSKISHSSAMMLKKRCLMMPLEWRLFHPCSKSIHKLHCCLFEGYVAFPPALSRKVWRVSPPQLTTNSTSLSKLVVCAMCWWARKWVHWIRALIHFLFRNVHFNFWMWFHFLSHLVPVTEWFGNPSPTNPLKSLPPFLHNLQNAPVNFHQNLTRERFLPTFCWISWFQILTWKVV